MNIFIGTSGYSYKEWKGSFYPKDLPAARMLRYYSEHFASVEMNNSFYKLPPAASFAASAAEVPAAFKFAVKAPQRITHFQRLKGCSASLRQFLRASSALKARRGPLLFQLPPNFKKDTKRLQGFLQLLPKDCRAAFEFRHQSWFDDETLALLRAHKVALCIAEEDDGVKVPFAATANWGYLRLRRSDYSAAELMKRAKQIQAQKWREAHIYFKHEDEGKGPRFAAKLMELVKLT